MNRHRLAALEQHGVGSLLDVGCGNGVYLARRRGFAAGVDITVTPSWQGGDKPFLVSDASRLPFLDASFDTVACFETIEHVEDPIITLQELHRVARHVGIFTVPNAVVTPGQRRSNLIFHHWIDDTHRNFFDAGSLEAALVSAKWLPRLITTVNAVDLGPLIVEAFRLPRRLERAVSGLYRRIGVPYPMTLLAVADASR